MLSIAGFLFLKVKNSVKFYPSDDESRSVNHYFKNMSEATLNVLSNIAEGIEGEIEKNHFLVKLLELFARLCLELEGKRASENASNLFKGTIDLTVFFNYFFLLLLFFFVCNVASSFAGNLGLLFPIIAAVIRRMPPMLGVPIETQLPKLFRDFWLNCLIMGFTLQDDSHFWLEEWSSSIRDIAVKSPHLVYIKIYYPKLIRYPIFYKTITIIYVLNILFYNYRYLIILYYILSSFMLQASFKSETCDTSDLLSESISVPSLATIKAKIKALLGNVQDVNTLVGQLNFYQACYVYSVYSVETLRVFIFLFLPY